MHTVCVYIMYMHTQEVLTVLLVLVISGSHFCMYINSTTSGYPRICLQDLNTIQYCFFLGYVMVFWHQDKLIKYVGFDVLLLTAGKISGTLHFAIMKYPFSMNYAATDLCVHK